MFRRQNRAAGGRGQSRERGASRLPELMTRDGGHAHSNTAACFVPDKWDALLLEVETHAIMICAGA